MEYEKMRYHYLISMLLPKRFETRERRRDLVLMRSSTGFAKNRRVELIVKDICEKRGIPTLLESIYMRFGFQVEKFKKERHHRPPLPWYEGRFEKWINYLMKKAKVRGLDIEICKEILVRLGVKV